MAPTSLDVESVQTQGGNEKMERQSLESDAKHKISICSNASDKRGGSVEGSEKNSKDSREASRDIARVSQSSSPSLRLISDLTASVLRNRRSTERSDRSDKDTEGESTSAARSLMKAAEKIIPTGNNDSSGAKGKSRRPAGRLEKVLKSKNGISLLSGLEMEECRKEVISSLITMGADPERKRGKNMLKVEYKSNVVIEVDFLTVTESESAAKTEVSIRTVGNKRQETQSGVEEFASQLRKKLAGLSENALIF